MTLSGFLCKSSGFLGDWNFFAFAENVRLCLFWQTQIAFMNVIF